MPLQRVRAVIAGEHDDRCGSLARLVHGPLGVWQGERRGMIANSCHLSPLGSGRPSSKQRITHVGRIRCRRYPAVAAMVDAARQSDRLLAGWLNIHAVDTNSRRPDKALQRCPGLRLDLADNDRARVERNIHHRLAQLGKRLGMRGTAVPEQKLSLIHISEPTRRTPISYAVFCLKKKKK